MEIILNKSKAIAFTIAMNELENKFNYVYIPGKLEDFVKLHVQDEQLQLIFVQPVPEMVKVACYMAFLNTIL